MLALFGPRTALAEEAWQDWQTYWQESGLPGTMTEMMGELAKGETPKLWERIGDMLRQDGMVILREGAQTLFSLWVMGAVISMMQILLGDAHPEAHWVMTLLAAGEMLVLCLPMIRRVGNTVETLCGFVSTAAPGIAVTLLAAGREASSQMLSPVGTAFVTLWSGYAKPVLLGSVEIGLVLTALDSLSPEHPMAGINRFLHSAMLWLLGISLTVLGGLLGLRTAVSASYDGIWMRSARYAVDHAVSGIGGALSEIMNTAAVSAGLTAAGMGISGLLILLATVIRPGLRLLLMALALEAGAGLNGIWGSNAVNRMWKDAAGWLKILLYGLLAAAFLAGAATSWICLVGNG